MKNIISISSLFILPILLSACGGGSADSNTVSTTSNTTINVLADMKGTYLVACEGFTSLASNGTTSDGSRQYSMIIEPDTSSNGAVVTIHAQEYVGSRNCNTSTLDFDVTATAQLSSKGTTKNYTDASGKTVTAKISTLTYTALKLSKGNISGSLPTFGSTATIAHVMSGKNLYVSKGHRGSDGIGEVLSTDFAVKQ